LDSYICA